ncbi:MAG: hypothetical protein QOF70_410 [Acetobacteraceae bacterium]|jgi:hypothetical protein|nr:hypothetical protein [Acetobacteraceae bacterium]
MAALATTQRESEAIMQTASVIIIHRPTPARRMTEQRVLLSLVPGTARCS